MIGLTLCSLLLLPVAMAILRGSEINYNVAKECDNYECSNTPCEPMIYGTGTGATSWMNCYSYCDAQCGNTNYVYFDYGSDCKCYSTCTPRYNQFVAGQLVAINGNCFKPSISPTTAPTSPTVAPTPSPRPSVLPSFAPTAPTIVPTIKPTQTPSFAPSPQPLAWTVEREGTNILVIRDRFSPGQNRYALSPNAGFFTFGTRIVLSDPPNLIANKYTNPEIGDWVIREETGWLYIETENRGYGNSATYVFYPKSKMNFSPTDHPSFVYGSQPFQIYFSGNRWEIRCEGGVFVIRDKGSSGDYRYAFYPECGKYAWLNDIDSLNN